MLPKGGVRKLHLQSVSVFDAPPTLLTDLIKIFKIYLVTFTFHELAPLTVNFCPVHLPGQNIFCPDKKKISNA